MLGLVLGFSHKILLVLELPSEADTFIDHSFRVKVSKVQSDLGSELMGRGLQDWNFRPAYPRF